MMRMRDEIYWLCQYLNVWLFRVVFGACSISFRQQNTSKYPTTFERRFINAALFVFRSIQMEIHCVTRDASAHNAIPFNSAEQ